MWKGNVKKNYYFIKNEFIDSISMNLTLTKKQWFRFQ